MRGSRLKTASSLVLFLWSSFSLKGSAELNHIMQERAGQSGRTGSCQHQFYGDAAKTSRKGTWWREQKGGMFWNSVDKDEGGNPETEEDGRRGRRVARTLSSKSWSPITHSGTGWSHVRRWAQEEFWQTQVTPVYNMTPPNLFLLAAR